MLALSSPRYTVVASIQQAQQHHKKHYDWCAKSLQARVGDWVLVRFLADESGRYRKLSFPWHGPFHVVAIKGPDVDVSNVYFPQDPLIMIHQSWVKSCPHNFPRGFYWCGGCRCGLGKPPQWFEDMLTDQQSFNSNTEQHSMSSLRGEGETLETDDSDLEDKDYGTDLSDVETPDQWTTMDNVGSQTETKNQPSTVYSPLTTQ